MHTSYLGRCVAAPYSGLSLLLGSGIASVTLAQTGASNGIDEEIPVTGSLTRLRFILITIVYSGHAIIMLNTISNRFMRGLELANELR